MGLFDGAPLCANPELGFATLTLDRAANRRDDAGWQKTAFAAPDSRIAAFCRDTPVLGFDGSDLEPLFTRERVQNLGKLGEPLFLGLDEGRPRFGVEVDPGGFDALKERTDLKLIDMRSIAMQGLFAPGLLNLVGTAKAMLSWHQRHRFCSNCGVRSDVASSGWKRVCPACKTEHFPRTDPVVIMLTIDGDRCLMGRSPHFAANRWSCLAGFMEPGETIEDAVRRETLEEAGISVGRVRFLAAQPWPFPSSLMIGCLAEATSTTITIDPAELADARWFSRAEVVAILEERHPDGVSAPPRMAIANHILRAFVDRP